jgi:hypothetical protein
LHTDTRTVAFVHSYASFHVIAVGFRIVMVYR